MREASVAFIRACGTGASPTGGSFLRSMNLAALSVLTLGTPAIAAPGDINAQTFYAKAVALKAKGPLALMSGDLKPMQAQMADAGKRVRADNLKAKAAGKPLYCPPNDRKGAGADFVLDGLAKIPESRRARLTLVKAWREILVAEFPCK